MPRDNESLIDIERAARRVLRYATDCDRVSLETNDEKVSAILYIDANYAMAKICLTNLLSPIVQNCFL